MGDEIPYTMEGQEVFEDKLAKALRDKNALHQALLNEQARNRQLEEVIKRHALRTTRIVEAVTNLDAVYGKDAGDEAQAMAELWAAAGFN